MSRSHDLARQAISRHELRGGSLEDAIAWAIERAIDEHGEVATGLTVSASGRYRGMNRIAMALSHAPATAAEVARRTRTDRGNAFRALAALCRHGYVVRRGMTYALADSTARGDTQRRRYDRTYAIAMNARHRGVA